MLFYWGQPQTDLSLESGITGKNHHAWLIDGEEVLDWL
jgi:hypothetical protein